MKDEQLTLECAIKEGCIKEFADQHRKITDDAGRFTRLIQKASASEKPQRKGRRTSRRSGPAR